MTCTITCIARTRRDLLKYLLEMARRTIRAISAIREEPCQHRALWDAGLPVGVGRYRAVLTIEDERLLILVLEAGDWSSVYR